MKKQAGFTLIELLVVISIISLLSSVVLASVQSARQKAVFSQTAANSKAIQTALELYKSDNGTYPYPGINITTFNPASPAGTNWNTFTTLMAPYIKMPQGIAGTSNPALPTTVFYSYLGSGLSTSTGTNCLGAGSDGYVILVTALSPTLMQNDGGIFPTYFEMLGGTAYKGTWSAPTCTPL
jgi:type II secretion system protein G